MSLPALAGRAAPSNLHPLRLSEIFAQLLLPELHQLQQTYLGWKNCTECLCGKESQMAFYLMSEDNLLKGYFYVLQIVVTGDWAGRCSVQGPARQFA